MLWVPLLRSVLNIVHFRILTPIGVGFVMSCASTWQAKFYVRERERERERYSPCDQLFIVLLLPYHLSLEEISFRPRLALFFSYAKNIKKLV